MIMIGLHLTKCAGTTLATAVRHAMSEDEYFFCSSFHENLLAARPMFGEIVEPQRLRLVFGHFIHEKLLSVFASKEIFLFTGLRDPVGRAVSNFHQVNAVHAAAGRPLVKAAEFLQDRTSSMCSEILRAFPSLSALVSAARWERAANVLGLFDYVYSSERFDAHGRFLLDILELGQQALTPDNVGVGQHLTEPGIAEEAEAVRLGAAKAFEQDVLLYDLFQPVLGVPHFRDTLPARFRLLDRTDAAESADVARLSYEEWLFGHMTHEFELLEKTALLRAVASKRRAIYEEILARTA